MIRADRVFDTPKDGHYFFGYYDKSPFSEGDELLLAQRSSFMNRLPSKSDRLELGYFAWRNGAKFTKFGVSWAWNWQTGCMLQWIEKGASRKVIYNTWNKDKGPHAVSHNLDSGHKHEYGIPVNAVAPDGTNALCLDFAHMQRVRKGYGYQGMEVCHESRSPTIILMNLNTGECRDVVKLGPLLELNHMETMKSSVHLLEHPVFSPNGDKFAFFHRWRLGDGAFYTRLYLYELTSRKLTLLYDSGRVSHLAWRNNDEIVVFAGCETPINRLRKSRFITNFVLRPLLPVYHLLVRHTPIAAHGIKGDGYALLSQDGSKTEWLVAQGLNQDGHPSFHKDRPDWMLTDTYPDRRQFAKLLLYSLSRNEVIDIDRISSVKKYDDTELRCDLHPRWSRTGKYVCIDHMAEGHRGMRVYDVSNMACGLHPNEQKSTMVAQ